MSPYEAIWSGHRNIDFVGFPGSVAGGAASALLTAPAYLWHLYVEYLWHYERHPWVASASATFKLLALLTIMPFVILSLLDVGAYVIARTLGVAETTRASTSDLKRESETPVESDGSEAETVQVDVVESPEREVAFPDSTATSDAEPALEESDASSSRFGPKLEIPTPQYPYIHKGLNSYGPEVEACFFSPSDERQLELGGALLSSPAPSRQGSPALDRRQRMQPLTASLVKKDHDAVETLKSEEISPADVDLSARYHAEKGNAALGDQGASALRRRMADVDGDAGFEA